MQVVCADLTVVEEHRRSFLPSQPGRQDAPRHDVDQDLRLAAAAGAVHLDHVAAADALLLARDAAA